MILVDTSVWINFFGGKDGPAVAALNEVLDKDIPFGITSVVYQELLQGTATERDFAELELYLRGQHFFHPLSALESYAEAARLYARCRRAGITIRSTIDCLIAQIAIEHDLLLLHKDRDYVYIAGVVPELRLYESAR